MIHNCIKCGDPLVIGENITQYGLDHYRYICRSCGREYSQEYRREHREQIQTYNRKCRDRRQKYQRDNIEHRREIIREWKHRTGRCQPMEENRECTLFLGVSVAERVLSHVFKHVERMPFGNTGYDFICGGGYMIEVKSSCRRQYGNSADKWQFGINKNRIAEYFLLLAFDNRDVLNPEHIWLIPAGNINHLVGTSISESRLEKWDKYRIPIDKVIACCDQMKESAQ